MKNISKLFLMAVGIFAIALIATTKPASAAQYCLTDSYGYVWDLDEVDSNSAAIYYSGTQTNPSGTFDASVMFNLGTGTVSMASSYGTAFHYSFKWTGAGGSGPWINTTGSDHGLVDVMFCGTATALSSSDGPAPGE